MHKTCNACGGVGKIYEPMPAGTIMGYSGPNGEKWPMIHCNNCFGSGFIPDDSVDVKANIIIRIEGNDNVFKKNDSSLNL